jgi:hypothetical protein
LIVVVMVAVLQTATYMLDRYLSVPGASANIDLGIGIIMAIGGGVVVIAGALVAMISRPNERLRRARNVWLHD